MQVIVGSCQKSLNSKHDKILEKYDLTLSKGVNAYKDGSLELLKYFKNV